MLPHPGTVPILSKELEVHSHDHFQLAHSDVLQGSSCGPLLRLKGNSWLGVVGVGWLPRLEAQLPETIVELSDIFM